MNNEEYTNAINLYNKEEINSEEFEKRLETLTDNLNSPLREFYIINAYLNDKLTLPLDKNEYLYANASSILESSEISSSDKSKIKCALINAYFSDGRYKDSEKYAKSMLNDFSDTLEYLKTLANYYTKTRRYELAGSLYNIITNIDKNELCKAEYKTFERINSHKQDPYFPTSKEHQDKYRGFMRSLRIKVNNSKINSQARNIHFNHDFDTFVAFDTETTGLYHEMDSIIELAAIRVVNGKIVEEKEFMFQELVYPEKKSIPKDIEKLTGITNEMAKNSKKMWEVLPQFMDFVKDDILVGYNCNSFDCLFLADVAKKYKIKIKNEYYDVLNLVKQSKDMINSVNNKLESVSSALGIKNPQAHRALGDAITTARVYLNLKEKYDILEKNDRS